MSPPPPLIEPRKSGLCMPEDEENWRELVADLREGDCALFLGSGCSVRDYGTWKQMVERVAAAAQMEVTEDLRPIDYPALLDLCRETMGENAYRDSLESILTPNGKEPYRPIHRAMIQAAFASYVTTNYDSSLENADCLHPKMLPAESVSSWPNDTLRPTKLRTRGVFHVHGRAYAEDGTCLLPNIVATDKDFKAAYDRGDVTSTLRTLFSDLSVLFVGFSSEDGLLERVIREHLGPYEDNLSQGPHPPENEKDEVKYYVLRDVCIRKWRVSLASGEEVPPTEVEAVSGHEWDAARVEATKWFQHPPWKFETRVRPIVYARREDDVLHDALTSLMNQLQQTAGCAAVDVGGTP